MCTCIGKEKGVETAAVGVRPVRVGSRVRASKVEENGQGI